MFDALHTGTESYQTGEALFRRGSVSPVPALSREAALHYHVGSTPEQTVTLYANGSFSCTCGASDTYCEHAAAAILKAREDGRLAKFEQDSETALGEKMLLALGRAMPGGENVRLSPMIRLYPDGRVGLGLAVGQDRLYAVKSIADLLTCYTYGGTLVLSPKFSYRAGYMRFQRDDERLLILLANYIPLRAESLRAWEDGIFTEREEREAGPATDGRFVILTGALLHGVMRFFESRPFNVVTENDKLTQSSIQTTDLPLCFSVALSATELTVQAAGAETLRLVTPDARFVFWDGHIVHLHSAQARVCRLLCTDGTSFRYPAREAEELLATLLPALSTVGTVIASPELRARLVNAPFRAAVYLDLVDGNVQARVEFRYGDTVLHPFHTAESDASGPSAPTLEDGKLLLRDGRAESALLEFFSTAGFVVGSGRIILRRTNDILTFCTSGVAELGKLAEVYASTAFNRVKPRKFTARASFRMHDGRLVMELLEEDGRPLSEVVPILQAIARRQQYVRLKTGEFLDVRDSNGLAPVANEVLDAAALDDPSASEDARELHFSGYRAAYMVSMLRMAGARTEADEEVEAAIGSLGDRSHEMEKFIPSRLQKKLTAYQQRGSGWILSLYESRMGGILADEMGLGKTVQIIAAISAAKRRDGVQKSIIVTPTSLTYHWLAELKRFDETLVVRVISGAREERRAAIEEIKQAGDVDVILTSYPLLRRDISLLTDIPLRFAVLDEAQSVKNAQSQGAAASKELMAQVRIALTGTPLENHTGELWSIFDFILPGYLGTQAAFLRRYGGGEHAEELRERIRPFLMRRLKADVLADLPGKTEQVLYAAMTPEQERVYGTLMESLRLHVGQAFDEGALPKARMHVLSILLKLRQVCCHPKLFLPDYEGTSGKLELLVQTVHNALAAKRRILVFSQFVDMLQMIRKRLAREGVSCLYLDGSTKPALRQELCDRFNGGEGRVFLISLKAGGTGLNLTGADLVIHYDPWWNPAAEDQATDRVHRIGQTRDVDVFRLITQGSIEEKVTDLSKRKRDVFDRVVMAGETDLAALTEEDIRALFLS